MIKKLKNEELNRLSIEEYRKTKKNSVIIILDNIRSLNNIGSVFRTADAFKIEEIYLCGYTATPPHKDIHKTALGSTESVNWKYYKEVTEAIKELQANEYKVYAIEQAEGSIMLDEFFLKEQTKIALIFGNEVKGVSNEAMNNVNGCIEIPQFGTKHSLNISVCAGIVMWDIMNKYNKS